MPRKYIKKTTKRSWSDESMKTALSEISEGKKIRYVSTKYEIPASTLRDYRSGVSSLLITNVGRKRTFTVAQENEIRDHLLEASKKFYGITLNEFRRMVFDYAEQNAIPNRFNKSTRLAGRDFYEHFLKRNPELSLRKPEATSINRITAFNETDVKLFYSNLENVFNKFRFEAGRVFNVDETGISTVQKPARIIGPKGQKQVGQAVSWERGKNVTVCCAMSAGGGFVPPLFIFPRSRLSPQLSKDGPPGAIYCCSKNGWITDDLFIEWLHHFIKFAKPTEADPVLLILDNHGSHKTLAAYELCRKHNVVVVSLPPHTSHRLQPLDVTFFGGLKMAFNNECDVFMKTNAYEKITPYDLAALFNKAYIRVATLEKGISGFKKTGIYPFNPNIFTEEDFLPASCNEIPENCMKTNDAVEFDQSNSTVPTISSCVSPLNFKSPSDVGTPMVRLHTAGTSTITSGISIENVSPARFVDKVINRKQLKRTGPPKQKSVIFTATPVKKELEIIAAKRKKKAESKIKSNQKSNKPASKNTKEKKGHKRLVRRKFSFSSSDTDNEVDETVLYDDDDELDDVDPFNNNDEICLICSEFGKNGELWYRCVSCGAWSHASCSGVDNAENYECDFCKNYNLR